MPTPILKTWISAFRLRTLPLASASILLGCFLAAADGTFSWVIAGLCFATAILLQILSNLANDYGDSIHGADSDTRIGPKRATQSGLISKTAMRNALILFVGLCLAIGYLLVRGEHLFYYLLGLGAIGAAIGYTVGPRPYGYAGLGDIFVFIFFGLVGVLGTYYLHTHDLNPEVLLPATASGLFSVGVLNINNIRDIESDKHAGKFTIPVRIGAKKAQVYHWFLLTGGIAAAVAYVILNYTHLWQFLFAITLPLFFINGRRVARSDDLDPQLRHLSITSLLFSLLFGLGLVL